MVKMICSKSTSIIGGMLTAVGGALGALHSAFIVGVFISKPSARPFDLAAAVAISEQIIDQCRETTDSLRIRFVVLSSRPT